MNEWKTPVLLTITLDSATYTLAHESVIVNVKICDASVHLQRIRQRHTTNITDDVAIEANNPKGRIRLQHIRKCNGALVTNLKIIFHRSTRT